MPARGPSFHHADKTEILMEEERKLREAMEQREGSSSPKVHICPCLSLPGQVLVSRRTIIEAVSVVKSLVAAHAVCQCPVHRPKAHEYALLPCFAGVDTGIGDRCG